MKDIKKEKIILTYKLSTGKIISLFINQFCRRVLKNILNGQITTIEYPDGALLT